MTDYIFLSIITSWKRTRNQERNDYLISLDFIKKKNGVPVLSKDKIEVLAEQVLSSYKPDLIFNPGVLDVELFIEDYANLEMDYQDLTHDGSILGMTVFNDCKIPVYDANNNKAKRISVNEGTVIIDNSLLEEEQLRRGRFTLAHEAAHWFLHRHMYIQDKNQISMFDGLEMEQRKLPVIKCRTSDIAYGMRKTLSTDDDWIEWHADYMASAMLMPKTAFVAATRDKFQSAKITKDFHQMGTDFEMDLWASVMAYELADLFQVSVTATNIRLINLGFIKEKQDQRRSLFE